MSTSIRELEPKEVWNRFADINGVPRPSKKEQKITAFMVDFGKKLGLETTSDATGNVIIRKPATAGLEHKKPIILQSHLDMVCQKNNDTVFDFDNQGIETYIDGDWVRAKGTTLGADNGMGVAAIMAILESKTIAHPAIEALFTTDEETGMTGAKKLSSDALKGEILLNLDTELDTEIEIGCAGGVDVSAYHDYSEEATPTDVVAYQLSITGLLGGHSGMEIHIGRGNANKIMNRLLLGQYEKHGLRLAHLHGGGLRNAIPREAEAVLTLPAENVAALKEAVETEWQRDLVDEYGVIEPNLKIEVKEEAMPTSLVPEEIQDNLVDALLACHNGVLRFIPHLPSIVETSSNLAIVEIVDGRAFFKVLVRSSRDTMRQYCVDTLEACFSMAGMKVTTDGAYPAWQPSPESEIVTLMEQVYKDLFAEDPKVQVVHAGLECSVILSHCPGMDVVSFGPTLQSPHTPNERCFIPSVEKYWRLVLETLARTPKK